MGFLLLISAIRKERYGYVLIKQEKSTARHAQRMIAREIWWIGDVDSPRSFTFGVRPIFSEQKPTLPNGRAPTTLDRE